jgi:hypothetical protein
MSKQIRIVKGRKVSTKQEVAKLDTGIFAGNSSYYLAYANEKDLYSESELFGKLPERVPVYFNPQYLNRINLYIGAMEGGKSNACDLLITSFSEARMIINDPKRERVMWAYDETKDIIICAYHKHGAIWHIFGDFKRKPKLVRVICKIMEKSQRGVASTQNQEWSEFMMTPLWLIVDKVLAAMDQGATENELYLYIAAAYAAVEAQYLASNDKMMLDALKVATPIVNTWFQNYYIGAHEKRKWITVSDLDSYRRVFMLGHPDYTESLKLINNAFFTMYAKHEMAKEDVPQEETVSNLSLWILEEFLSGIDLDEETLKEVVGQCRAKAISIHMLVQALDKEHSEKLRALLPMIKASWYLTGAGELK